MIESILVSKMGNVELVIHAFVASRLDSCDNTMRDETAFNDLRDRSNNLLQITYYHVISHRDT